MGDVFTDVAKEGLKLILALWDEKRERDRQAGLDPSKTEPPSFLELSKQIGSPAANSIITNSGAQDYKAVIKLVRRYDDKEKRKLLDPRPPAPPSPPVTKQVSRRSKSTKVAGSNQRGKHSYFTSTTATPRPTPPPEKPVQTPQEALEAPQSSNAANPSTQTQKQPQKPPKAAPMYRNFTFDSKAKEKQQQKRSPHATLTQSIGSLIPPEILAKFDNEEPAAKKDSIIDKVHVDFDDLYPKYKLINYCKGIIIIAKNYEEYIYKEDIDYETESAANRYSFKRELDNPYAEVIDITAKDENNCNIADKNEQLMPVNRHSFAIKLVKGDTKYDFPEPEENVFLLVEREVAEAARMLGRSTDDLFFPDKFSHQHGTGNRFCSELGKL